MQPKTHWDDYTEAELAEAFSRPIPANVIEEKYTLHAGDFYIISPSSDAQVQAEIDAEMRAAGEEPESWETKKVSLNDWLVDWEEEQHPRAPDGKWTSGGDAAPAAESKSFKANWRGEKGSYHPGFFKTTPDVLQSESGEVVGTREKLVPTRDRNSNLPTKANPDLVYRGVSAGEFEAIVRSGEVRSSGSYNIGKQQEGLTYFSTDPDMAVSYANSFAPSEHKPNPEKPAYVIAVKRPSADRLRKVEGTGAEEVGVVGAIPASDIVQAFRGDVVAYQAPIEEGGFRSAGNATIHWSEMQKESAPIANAKPTEETYRFKASELTPLPADRMKDEEGAGLKWEYEREYLRYGAGAMPEAFANLADFEQRYKETPLTLLSDEQYNKLDYTSINMNRLPTFSEVRGQMEHRRDVKGIRDRMFNGITTPPIILKRGDKLRLLGGQTRIFTGFASGFRVPVKVIDVTQRKKKLVDEWREADHPRVEGGEHGGEFTSGGGGGGGAAEKGQSRAPATPETRGGSRDYRSSSRPASDRLSDTTHAEPSYEAIHASLPAETRAALDQAEQAIKTASAKTDDPVSKGGFKLPDGTYTPEREAIHKQIVQEFLTQEAVAKATPKPGAKPVYLMLGGRPASGKTTSLRKSPEYNDFISINPDVVQEHLPGYKPELAGLYHDEAVDIAKVIDHAIRDKRLNTVYDATLRDENGSRRRLEAYEAAGYEVHGLFVHVSPENAMKRAAGRFMTERRYVPLRYVHGPRTHEETFDKLIPHFERWALYDNNGKEPVLLASGTKGKRTEDKDWRIRDAAEEETKEDLSPITLPNGSKVGPESFENDRSVEKPDTHSQEFETWLEQFTKDLVKK